MKEWSIGLSPWILADGNYSNFHRGQVAEFALEFYPQSAEITQRTEKTVELIDHYHYKAVAEVMFYSQKLWVIDFGLLAFNESKVLPDAKVGDFVETEFHLGIDPFFYFERHYKLPNKLPNMLPLIYTWQVDKIIVQSAPLVGRWNAAGQHWYEPDATNYSYYEVEQTGGKKYNSEQEALQDYYTRSGSDILACSPLNAQAKFGRSK